MALTRPVLSVTVNGSATAVLEAHTTHSIDSPVAQASLVLGLPLPAQVVEDAPVRIEAGDENGTAPIFVGRIRGPIEKAISESDKTCTVRCDGNLWRASLPNTRDLSWAGPISVRKVIKSALTFRGVGNLRIEPFVHPVTGVPLLLGGVPWIDSGRVILEAGTSPLAFCERICKLFGYRIFDAPDGSVRVARINGPPTEPQFTLTEGSDFLNVSNSRDLHEIVTYWEAQGASATDPAGQEINIVSRPVMAVPSPFVPIPPGQVRGTVSDQLLVTQTLANAARIAQEYDYGGPSHRVRGEIPGTVRQIAGIAERRAFRVIAPSLGMPAGYDWDFWQTSIAHDFTPSGYWISLEGWRPTGKPATTAPPPPIPPTPPDASDDPAKDPGTAWDESAPPLPTTWPGNINVDADPAPPANDNPPDGYEPATDPDYDEAYPDGAAPPPDEGTVDVCETPPVAPARLCATQVITEDGWVDEGTEAAPVSLTLIAPAAGDIVTISGELQDGPVTVQLYRGAGMLASAAVELGTADWAAFSVDLAADVVANELLEVRIVAGVTG